MMECFVKAGEQVEGGTPMNGRRPMGFIMDGCRTRAPTAQPAQASPSRSCFHQLLMMRRSSVLDISCRSFSAGHININLLASGEDNALYLLDLKFTSK